MNKTIRIIYTAYRLSIRSGRTSLKEFLDALHLAIEAHA